jgi:hypothetical protein
MEILRRGKLGKLEGKQILAGCGEKNCGQTVGGGKLAKNCGKPSIKGS